MAQTQNQTPQFHMLISKPEVEITTTTREDQVIIRLKTQVRIVRDTYEYMSIRVEKSEKIPVDELKESAVDQKIEDAINRVQMEFETELMQLDKFVENLNKILQIAEERLKEFGTFAKYKLPNSSIEGD